MIVGKVKTTKKGNIVMLFCPCDKVAEFCNKHEKEAKKKLKEIYNDPER